MALLRYVILGVLLALVGPVNAETIPAISSGTSPVQGYTRVVEGLNKWYNTLGALCTSQNRTLSSNGSYPDGCCYDATSGICSGPGGLVSRCPAADGADVVWPVNGVCTPVYSCPTGQNWTLSGTNCVRPDCAAYQTLNQTTGVCGCPEGRTDTGTSCQTPCPSGYHVGVPDNGQCIADCTGRQTQGTDGQCTCAKTGGVIAAARAALDTACIGGCSVKWNVGLRSLDNTTVYGYVSFNGATCAPASTLIPATVAFVPKDTSGKAADGVTPDPKNVPETNQSPEACDAVGGSWGVYNGASKCLSAKDVNTMDKLTVTKTTSTSVNPDGTSKVTTDTTTKTVDAQTGQVTTSTITSTVNKDAQGNVVGTGTGTSDIKGDSSSDLCKNNPGLDICQNRLNKEETQVKVLAALQGDGDYSAIENAQADAQKAELTAAHEAAVSKLSDHTFDAVVSEQKQTIVDTIGSWWDPVPMSGCTPLSATVGGRVFTLDPCPVAEKVSGIAGYAMWAFLAFGVLGLFVKRGAE